MCNEFRRALLNAEAVIGSFPQLNLEVIHHFSPGIYARELKMPEGIILTGKIHKTEHLCIVNGDIEIMSEDGGGRFSGHHIFVSKPGIKRIGRTYADTVFTTIHATDKTDIDELELDLVVETYEQYQAYMLENNKCIEVEL